MADFERSLKRAALIAFGMVTLSAGQVHGQGIGERVQKAYGKVMEPVYNVKRDIRIAEHDIEGKVRSADIEYNYQKRTLKHVAGNISADFAFVGDVVNIGKALVAQNRTKKEMKRAQEEAQSQQQQYEEQQQEVQQDVQEYQNSGQQEASTKKQVKLNYEGNQASRQQTQHYAQANVQETQSRSTVQQVRARAQEVEARGATLMELNASKGTAQNVAKSTQTVQKSNTAQQTGRVPLKITRNR